MTKPPTTLAALAAVLALFAGCAEAESPKPSLPLESPDGVKRLLTAE